MSLEKWKLSAYLQTEEAECGLMCLAAASHLLGSGISAVDARQWFGASARGMSIADLCEKAGAIGLVSNAVACAPEELNAVDTPAILHWHGRHYCVLVGKRRRRYTIFDPSSGLRTLSLEELAEGFSGSVIQLARDPAAPLQKSKAANLIVKLWMLSGDAKGQIALLLALSFVIQLVSLALPLLSQVAINFGAVQGSVAAVTMVATTMLAVYGLSFVVEVWRGSINHAIATILSGSTSRQLFRHLLYLPVDWFERRRVADVVSRFESVEPLRHAVSSGLATLVVDGVLGLLVAVGLLAISPLLGGVVVLSVMVTAVVKALFAPIVAAQSASASNSKVHEQAKRWETFRSVSTLKLACAENAQDRTWGERMDRYLQHTEQAQRHTTYQQSVASLANNIGSVAVLYAGAILVVKGGLSIGGLFAFVMYRRYLADKVGNAVDQLSSLWSLRYHLDRVSEVFKTSREKRWNDQRDMGEYVTRGSISFRKVSFRHNANDPLVIRNIEVKLEPGETVFICGPSGSGKSTILRLVAGLISPSSGDILIDDVPMANMSPHQIRSAMAAVLQDDDLFAGSIFENITMFANSPDLGRAIQALEKAELWADIKQLPMGIHTPIGESGRLLSAGQRQRILIARVFYRNPMILLLDEATANIDPETEARIFERLKSHRGTKLVVSHSFHLSKLADRVFVLDERGFRELGRRVGLAEAV